MSTHNMFLWRNKKNIKNINIVLLKKKSNLPVTCRSEEYHEKYFSIYPQKQTLQVLDIIRSTGECFLSVPTDYIIQEK